MRTITGAIIVWFSISIFAAFWVAVIGVAIHFISKFW